MKITKNYLKQVIKEEVDKLLNESSKDIVYVSEGSFGYSIWKKSSDGKDDQVSSQELAASLQGLADELNTKETLKQLNRPDTDQDFFIERVFPGMTTEQVAKAYAAAIRASFEDVEGVQ